MSGAPFFAYSGLRTDVALLADPRLLWIGVAVLLLGSLGKVVGGSLAARWSGLPWREAASLGVLVNMRGLMQLVVLNVGLDLGLLSPSLFAILVLSGLATTAVAGPLLRRLQPAGIALRAPTQHTASVAASTSTLLCVPEPRGAATMALLSHALAHDPHIGSVYALELEPSQRADAGDADGLGALVERAAELGTIVRTLSFVSIDPGEDICRTADVKGADLVLLGAPPLEGTQVVDATVLHVLRTSRCAVGVLVAGESQSLTRTLVVRDEVGEVTLDVASRIATRTGIELGELADDDDASASELVVLAIDSEGRTRPEAAAALAAGRSVLLVRAPREPLTH